MAKGRRKPFEDMSRSELEQEGLRLQAQLAQVVDSIAAERTRLFKITGKPPRVTDYPELEQQRANLQWMFRKANTLLQKMPKADDNSESARFQKMAQKLLEPALYEYILNQARQIQRA